MLARAIVMDLLRDPVKFREIYENNSERFIALFQELIN